jgi:non-ribosomal peptide synthase protein (TIGR01720 family)
VHRTRDALRALPRRGLPFGVVRELAGEPGERLRALPTPALAFNYLGQWDASIGQDARFALASESPGIEHDPDCALPYELEIDAAVHGGRFEASLRYSRERYRTQTVARLASELEKALRELLHHVGELIAAPYSPSDFPDVALASEELTAILAQLD